MTPTLAPEAGAPHQSNNAGMPNTSTRLQDRQVKLRDLCRRERERGTSMVLERKVENLVPMTRSLLIDPGRADPKSTRNWTKPPDRSIIKSKPLVVNVAQGQVATDKSTPTLATTAFAPALRTPGFSPSKKAEDQLSWVPTQATLRSSSLRQARPFSRLLGEQITANSSQINMSENSVVRVVARRADPTAHPFT